MNIFAYRIHVYQDFSDDDIKLCEGITVAENIKQAMENITEDYGTLNIVDATVNNITPTFEDNVCFEKDELKGLVAFLS